MGAKRGAPEERFWRFVSIADGCWNWAGGLSGGKGYGLFANAERTVGAHRFAYELAFGAIPSALQIDHLCANRRCVNPAHMEVVTPHENMLRASEMRGCKRGHP